MGRIPVVHALILYLVAFSFFPSSSFAQRSFGVIWDVPENHEEAIRQLDQFENLKIKYIEVGELVTDEIWSEISQRDFNVFVQIPVTFPVIQTFEKADSSLVRTFQEFLTRYGATQVDAIGAFAYGQTNHPRFARTVQPFTEQMDSALSVPLYYKKWNREPQAVDSLFEFHITRIEVTPDFHSVDNTGFSSSGAFLYAPSGGMGNRMAPLKWFIEKTSVNPQAPLFFESGWLLNFINKHRSTEQILIEYATYQDAVFPLPQEPLTDSNSHSIIVLVLLALWGTVALTYSFIPTYRRSLFRFFLSHQFFIEDVMQRHIRSIVPSLVLLGQHAVLGGIFLYCMANTYLSSIGVEVFYFYFPILNIFGSGHLSFFFLGIIFTLLFQTISLLWLYIANWGIGYLSQISILYSWPFHLNLVITTVIVTLLMSGGNTYLMGACFILFVAVLLLDFPITAFDTGRNVTGNRWVYASGTLGLYTLVVAVLAILVVTNDRLLNILDLVISIS